MNTMHLAKFMFLLLGVCSFNVLSRKVHKMYTYGFFMPDVFPYNDDALLCSQILIRDNFYLVGFEPKASMEVTSHILLYGCREPGSNETLWDCDASQKIRDQFYTNANPCRNEAQIVYVWSRNTGRLRLPHGVGFYIGPDSPIKYLVLQVHYPRRLRDARSSDNSGVFLNYTKQHMLRQAGVLVLGTRGVVPANSVEHMEATCTIRENKTLHPFAFYIHTHALGKVVSGYVVRQGMFGDSWSSLGKKNPQKPQKFFAVRDTTPIRLGDILALRCTIHNVYHYSVPTGKEDWKEMCFFFLMYWVERDTPLKQKSCISPGPPTYYWHYAIENFENIPHDDASNV